MVSRISSLPGLFTVNSVNDERSTLLQGFQDGWHALRVMWQDQTIISGLWFTGAKLFAIFTILSCITTGPIFCRLGQGLVLQWWGLPRMHIARHPLFHVLFAYSHSLCQQSVLQGSTNSCTGRRHRRCKTGTPRVSITRSINQMWDMWRHMITFTTCTNCIINLLFLCIFSWDVYLYRVCTFMYMHFNNELLPVHMTQGVLFCCDDTAMQETVFVRRLL